MFANADRAFITYIKHVEIYIVPMSNDIPAEYRVFGRAGEGGALMDATIPALCRRSINIYIYIRIYITIAQLLFYYSLENLLPAHNLLIGTVT